MGQFTVNTTARQDGAIAYLVSQGQAPNAEAFVQQAVSAALQDAMRGLEESERVTLGTAFRNATQAQRDQVRTLLGL